MVERKRRVIVMRLSQMASQGQILCQADMVFASSHSLRVSFRIEKAQHTQPELLYRLCGLP